jgi:hypothetical protein
MRRYFLFNRKKSGESESQEVGEVRKQGKSESQEGRESPEVSEVGRVRKPRDGNEHAMKNEIEGDKNKTSNPLIKPYTHA